ncbi:hypothetical protein BTO04_00375 [Polaribacter sp. SA4-10]|uniref:hypothetical protein n=1 Tax=Polaribacter sp. SA4-10 TaxID=754397 RepID=UPI000B3CF394|nr:hypothetical protein [Polaribacter sp. SA4-10]ARV05239.1 hypothetical protein BTO04_00375 [Polaribacter sp. SA4-10]
MKLRVLVTFAIVFLLNSCVSVPKETVQLSKLIGKDLIVLQRSHKTMVELFYKEIINNIDGFIEDVYAPFIIHYVLKGELDSFNNQRPSIFGAIEDAGKIGGKAETEKAFNEMTDFLKAANTQIKKKTNELLDPIQKQKDSVIRNINTSYENTRRANSSVTNYLQSILNLKESQKEVLSIVGLQGKDEELNNTLLKVSEFTKSLLTEGRKIDIKSDDAFDKMKTISDKIKSITNKK